MSKVVFVGNVPYNMGEEQLINVFKTVGQVVGFRLVFDRETGKPRGYGFCEFADHETAASAVRNLNNVDVGGRPLRIDLADSDPFLEGKTTMRGELVDGGETRSQWRERERERRDREPGSGSNPTTVFLQSLPPGIPVPPGVSCLDMISSTLASMNPAQLTEVLAQMKAFVISHPDQARALLIANPQLAYALFQALLLNKIVDSSILDRMLAQTNGGGSQPPPTPVMPQHPVPPSMPGYPSMYPPPPPPPHHMHQQHQQHMQQHMTQPPPPQHQQHQHPPPQHQQHQHMGGIPPQHQHSMAQPPPQHMAQPPPSMSPYYGARPPSAQQQQPLQPPPAQAPIPPPQQQQQQQAPPQAQPAAVAPIDPAQKDMIMQVLSLSQDQINALPPNEREAIQQLRNQFMGVLSPLS